MGLFTCKIDKSDKQACKYLSLMRARALMRAPAEIEEAGKKQ